MTTLRIPLHGEADLMWGYFVLQAARGSVRVPEWVRLALPRVVAARVGVQSDRVEEKDLDLVLSMLPESPVPVLRRLLKGLDMEPPDPVRDEFLLADEAVVGSFRKAVNHEHLLHDASLLVVADYGRESFLDCLRSVEDPENWDARGAVAAMIYLLVLLNG